MANIDKLDIEISAESDEAIKKINALADSLKKLQSSISGIETGGLKDKLKDISKVAQDSMPTNVKKRSKSLQSATGNSGKRKKSAIRDIGQPDMGGGKVSALAYDNSALNSAAESAENLGDRLEKAAESAEKLSNTKVNFNFDTAQKQIAKGEVEAEKASHTFELLKQKLENLKNIPGVDVNINIENAEKKISELGNRLSKTKEALSDFSGMYSLIDKDSAKEDIAYVKELANTYKEAKYYSDLAAKSAKESIAFAEQQAKPEIEAFKLQNALKPQDTSGFSKQIAAAEIEAEKATHNFDLLKQKLQSLIDTPGVEIDVNIETASERLKEFEDKIAETRDAIDNLKSEKDKIGETASVESIAHLQELADAYKNVKYYADLAAKSAKESVGFAGQKAKPGIDAFKGQEAAFSKQIASYTKDISNMENALAKMQEKLAALKSSTSNADFGDSANLKKLSDSVSDYSGKVQTAKEALSEMQSAFEGFKSTDLGMDEAKKKIDEVAQSLRDVVNSANESNKSIENAFNGINIKSQKIDFSQLFSGELGNTDIGKTINQIMKAAEQFEVASKSFSEAGGFENGMSQLMSQISGVTSETSTASAAMGELSGATVAAGTEGAAAMAGLTAATGGLAAIIPIIVELFQRSKEFVESNRSIWTDLSAENVTGGLSEGFNNLIALISLAHPEVLAFVYAIRSFIQPGQELLGVLKGVAEDGIGRLASAAQSLATSGIRQAGEAVKDFAKNSLQMLYKSAQQVSKYFGNRFIRPIQKAIETFNQWKASIARIGFYRAVRAAVAAVTSGFREGIDNLYKYSQAMGTSFAPAMDSLASSALYLKNSLAAMAAPLITALAPAIDFIISKLVTLLNLIGAVFAALTGKGVFTTAKKQATQFGDALGGAAGSAKQLKDYLLGIDELNVINEDSGGGGGGGGGGFDFSDMFEETELPDWAQRIKDAIEAGDWYGAGTILADHLNGLLDQWDSREWGQNIGIAITRGLDFALGFLREFDFDKFGRKIADAFNGIGEAINWDTLGRVIGAGWNALYESIDGFFRQFEWNKWGKYIGTAFNGLVDEVNWGKIGQTISDGIIGVAAMIDNAIRTTDWVKFGKSIAEAFMGIDYYGVVYASLVTILDAIKAAFIAIDSFMREFDWIGTANDVAKAITDAFNTVTEEQWKFIANTIANMFINVWNWVANVINQIPWREWGTKIGNALASIPWNEVLIAMGNAMVAGINAAIEFVYGIVTNPSFWVSLQNGIRIGITNFFNKLEIKDAIIALEKTIVGAISLVVAAIKGLVEAKEFWEDLGRGIQTGIANFFRDVPPSVIIETLTDFIIKAIDVAIDGIVALATGGGEWWNKLCVAIANGINRVISEANWEELLPALAKLATDILNGIANGLATIDWDKAWKEIKNALDKVEWEPIIEAGLNFFKEAFFAKMKLKLLEGKVMFEIGKHLVEGLFEGIGEMLKGVGAWIAEKFQAFIDGVKNFFGIHSPSTVMAEIGGDIIAGLLKGISEGIGNVVEAIKGVLSGIGDAISKTWENIKTTASQAWTNIASTISTVWESINSTAKDIWENGILSTITKTWENLKTKASETWTNLKETVSKGWDNAKEKTTNVWNSVTSWLGEKWSWLTGKEKTEFGNMKTDISNKWDETQSDTNTKWSGINAFLDETWTGIRVGSQTEFSATYTNISTAWDDTETKTNTSWSAQDTLLRGVWAGLNTQAATDFSAMSKTVDTEWGNAKTSTDTQWNAAKTVAEGIWAGMATSATTQFSNIAKTVDTESGNAKTSSDTQWTAAKTVAEGLWAGMATSASAQFGAMSRTVESETSAQESSVRENMIAANAVHLAQMTAMGTNTIFQFAAMNKTVKNAMSETVQTTTDQSKAAITAIKTQFGQAAEAVQSGLSAALSAAKAVDFTSVGSNIVNGVRSGIESGLAVLKQSAVNAINAVKSAAQNAAKIHSPSRLFKEEIGENIGLGIALGIEDTISDMESAMYNSMSAMQSALDQNQLEAQSALQFQEPEKLSADYAVQYSQDDDRNATDNTQQMADSVRIANEDVIAALQAGFTQMVEAVQEIASRPVSVSIGNKAIMQANERGVRARGANIMAGGLM